MLKKEPQIATISFTVPRTQIKICTVIVYNQLPTTLSVHNCFANEASGFPQHHANF